MAYFLYGLFFVSCLVLIAAVLLQPGKTDAGALFTSNISSTSFTPRGSASVLSKLTIIAATCFMLSALLLSMPGLTGNVSVLQTAGEETEAISAGDADANANTSTDANTAVDGNSNTATDSNANVAAPSDVKPAETRVEEVKPDAKADDKKPEEKKPESK